MAIVRHTRTFNCPVCGGNKSDKPGQQKRCYGFTSEDGEWIHCTREEHSGGLPLAGDGASKTYAHKASGPCKCGVTHSESAASSNGNGHKKAVRNYVYELINDKGELVAKHIRKEYSDGDKGFYFHPSGIKSDSLPLYGVPQLQKVAKGSDVFLVEGEKKSDALRKLGFSVVATATGSGVTPYKASLKVLEGYRVYLWPDNDDGGRSHMENIGNALRELKIERLFINWIQAPKKGDVGDFIEQGGTADGIRELMKSAQASSGNWEDPIPLEEAPRPEFPTDALPQWLGDWVSGISTEMQTPPDLAAMLALSVLASSVSKKYKIHIKDNWTEPLNLMVAVALPPGERKSAVFAEAIKPIVRYECENAARWRVEFQERKTEYELAERRLKSAMKVAETSEIPDMGKLKELSAAMASMKPPVVPRIYADDVTPEKLGAMLADQNGRLAIFSAEGGIFGTLAGRYSDGLPSLDTVLKAHGGDPIRVDRLGREANIINSPALTLGLSVQPGVLGDLGSKKEFMTRGLLARFLYSIPKSKMGQRLTATAGADKDVRERFCLKVKLLLDRPEKLDDYGEINPTFLKFSTTALACFLEYATQLEPRLGQDGDLWILGGWASKLMGAIARIAGILHLAEHSTDPFELGIPEIPDTSVIAALSIGDYLIEHVKGAFHIIGNYSSEEARKILDWLKKHSKPTVSKRDIWKAVKGHVKKVKELDEPLKLLEELGWIKPIEHLGNKHVGRPSVTYNVHPKLL